MPQGLLKLLLVPTMILLVSLAGRRWGVAATGWLGGLPVVAGPIILLLGLEHGGEFAREASAGLLLGVFSLSLFCWTYAWLATCCGVLWALAGSILMFALSTAALSAADPPLGVSLAGVVTAIVLCLSLLPSTKARGSATLVTPFELGLRMAAAAVLVGIVTALSAALGPHLSGLLAPFPIAGSVLAGFTHRVQGSAAVVALLRGFLKGLLGMAAFAYVIADNRVELSFFAIFCLASVAAIAVSVSVSLWACHTSRIARHETRPT